jgi:hypothetical protein
MWILAGFEKCIHTLMDAKLGMYNKGLFDSLIVKSYGSIFYVLGTWTQT